MKGYTWTVLVILATMISGLVVGCGPTATPEPVEEPVDEPTTAPAVEPPSGDSAAMAIEAAQEYSGITLNVVREAGLQAQDPLTMGPIFEEKTGIKINVIEMSYNDMYTNQLQDHLTGGGAYDVLDVSPFWMIDYVNNGVLEPLNPYIEKYMNPNDLDDYLEVYSGQGVMSFDGTYYGLYDDGDVFVLYYRKDLFEDPDNQAEFESQYGYELVPPETWEQFQDAGEFFTEKYAPDIYGGACQRAEGQAYSWFIGPYAGHGGHLFDPDTMEAEINSEIAVRTLTEMVEQNEWMPPGVQKWGFMEVLSAWMDGKLAMTITWPPYGRWGAGYGDTSKQLEWVPPSNVIGKVGYKMMPGGRSTLAGGFNIGVSASSNHKEAAYLYAQWMSSPSISLQRVMLPYTLRDPYRESHFESALYRSAWPEADQYLETLEQANTAGVWEPGIPGGREYMEALDKAITAAYGGEDVTAALDDCAARWDEITERLGVDAQKEAYNQWLQNPWAQPGPTVEAP